VVVNDFDLFRASFAPGEADPELVVDTNAVLAMAVTPERLQAVAWRNAQIVETACGIKDGELAVSNAGDAPKPPDLLALEQSQGVTAAKRPDHGCSIPASCVPMQGGGMLWSSRRPQLPLELLPHLIQFAAEQLVQPRPAAALATEQQSTSASPRAAWRMQPMIEAAMSWLVVQ
jgi:hypothetical protein